VSLWRRRVVVLMLGLAVAFNAIAFRQAWTFTHPVRERVRRVDPRRLPFTAKLGMLLFGLPNPRTENDESPRAAGMPFERHIVPGARTRPVLEGWLIPGSDTQTVVVLFHGHGGVKSDLLGHAQRFLESGATVFLVDFPGAGGSGDAPTTIGWSEAEDVTRTVRYVRALTGARRVFLYGLSMGAVAVMKAMADGVPVDGAILECPFDSLLNTVQHRFQTIGAPSFPAAHALLFWGGVQGRFDPFHHGALTYAPRIRTPVLLMTGGRDPWATPAETRAVFEAFRGPKRLVICPTVGHDSCLTRRPALWTSAVRAFLVAPVAASSATAE
jgi:alpha-beta hydrolase superfamily lysophospholipase